MSYKTLKFIFLLKKNGSLALPSKPNKTKQFITVVLMKDVICFLIFKSWPGNTLLFILRCHIHLCVDCVTMFKNKYLLLTQSLKSGSLDMNVSKRKFKRSYPHHQITFWQDFNVHCGWHVNSCMIFRWALYRSTDFWVIVKFIRFSRDILEFVTCCKKQYLS